MTRSTVTHEASDSAEGLSTGRQILYRFASLSLTDPRAGSWELLRDPESSRLAREAAAYVRSRPEARASALARGEQPLEMLDPAAVFDRLPKSRAELNTTYERAFGLLASGPCPPHETDYIGEKHTFQRSHVMADVAGFYRAFGLRPSARHPERHDHVALELEFMAFLFDAQRRARQSGDGGASDRARVCADARRRFFVEHLVWWTPVFGRLLAHETAGGFYAAVGDFLAALIPAERAILQIEAPQGEASPRPIERPEACDGCAL